MPKASPMVRSFNAGEFSPLLDGRVDLDRYSASMRSMVNFIAAPQGPAICRSGTALVTTASDESEYSTLLPFVFSNEQAKVLEFSADRIRFLDAGGLQVYTGVASTVLSALPGVITLNASGLNANVGDQVVLSGFPASYNLNGETGNITGKAGSQYTLDTVHPDMPRVACTAARVYHVACTYTEEQRRGLGFVQSVDVMYLLARSSRPKKLSRFGTYDWRLEDIEFSDGPYLDKNTTSTTLTPTSTGNAVPNMTNNTSPSGTSGGSGNRPDIAGTQGSPVSFLGRNISYDLAESEFFYAFDDDDATYWASDAEQGGTIQYTPSAAFACDGYTIYPAKDNQDTSYSARDFAPSTFRLEGYDGTSWTVLDEQEQYVLYEGNKSVFIELDNTVAYDAYRLVTTELMRNGLIEPRIRRLVLRDRGRTDITLNASSTTGINDAEGFLSTDVGRVLRLRGSDGAWRECRITAVSSSTQVTVKLLGEPFLDTKSISQWRLGAWSDTTGWPYTGDFLEDRLWLAGSEELPDFWAASVTGAYETFSPSDTFGVVLDTNAIAGRLNSRRMSRIRWLSSDDRGVLIGTGSEEYTLSTPGKQEGFTPRNTKARPATRRGSAEVRPVRIDNQALFVQRSGRAVREFSFSFESDGYQSPSMSQLASHLGAKPFVEMEYASEPHSIIWVRRSDGSLVGLTYNREENVMGWHQHDLSGGEIETLAVIPQADELQDALWVVVKREVDGSVRRYVERLTHFWDFGSALASAHLVDSALRYEGDPITDVYGLQHLEGEEVYGLADNRPTGALIVANGSVTLPYAASNIVIGLGYDSVGVLPRLENGAADGTSQGKIKRINSLVLSVWDSFGGEAGVYNEQEGGIVYEPLQYPERFDTFEDVSLFSGLLAPIQPAPGYDMNGIIAFRRPKSSPLPFNPVAVMPQLNTQDR